MEIKITSQQVLKVLQILSWIIFIGLCIEAGALIVNTAISLFINPGGVNNFWDGTTYLSGLYKFDRGYFSAITLVMIIVAVLKACMFYLIVKIFTEKKIDLAHPFNTEFNHFILMLSYLAFGIGLFSHSGLKYTAWLKGQGAGAADLDQLNIEGAAVWLFMAVILFVIGHIVKRGVEIQKENDLTI